MTPQQHVIDTNVLLRFFTRDNEEQYQQAVTWFKEAEQGKRKILISPLVVAECCYVLESFYKQSRQEIADTFEVFLAQKWLLVEKRELILGIWEDYKNKLGFVDCYLLRQVRSENMRILSFDKKLLSHLQTSATDSSS